VRPSHHVMLSTAVSAGFGYWSGSWTAAGICLVSGVLIDLDHHLDYVIVRREIPWRYADLWAYCMEKPVQKIYLFFHSWEQQAILWGCIYAFGLGWEWIGLALGMTTHMIADALANPVRPWAYFLSYRAALGFQAELILKKDLIKNASENRL
jgi:hypothetical protein